MAEQALNSVASAVTGEITNRAFSGLTDKFGKQAAPGEKLQRLEMLLIKIHSAVEASEKHTIENSSLLQWRDKLKEAASQGDEVLASFRQRDTDAEASSSANQQQQGASSAAASATASAALYFTRNALSGVVHGIRNAANMMFSSDKDIEKLNSAVEKLEKLSPEIGEFISLLQLEVLPKLERSRPKKRKILGLPNGVCMMQLRGRPAGKIKEPTRKISELSDCLLSLPLPLTYEKDERGRPADHGPAGKIKEPTRNEIHGVSRRQPVELRTEEYELWNALMQKLTEAYVKIVPAVAMVEDRKLKDWGWLTQWVTVLREALQRGMAMMCSRKFKYGSGDKETVICDHEMEEIYSFVRSFEILAGDAECFGKLAVLCPWGEFHVLNFY